LQTCLKIILTLSLLALTPACSLLDPFREGTTVSPSAHVSGDNNKLQQTEGGSTAQAGEIGEVVTINEGDGLPVWAWLIIGMLLPMPKFMRLIF